MVKISSLHVGDKVQIVSEWVDNCHQNHSGRMDKWLGAIMTVRHVDTTAPEHFVQMSEDMGEGAFCDGWAWYAAAIACVVCSPQSSDEFDGDIDLSKLLMGGI